MSHYEAIGQPTRDQKSFSPIFVPQHIVPTRAPESLDRSGPFSAAAVAAAAGSTANRRS